MAKTDYDLIIVGAGMVGATLACALGKSGFRIALLEVSTPKSYIEKKEFDLRVSAISLASERIFRNIGVWGNIATKRISPYQEMHVWDARGDGEIRFDSAEVGEPYLGHIIENNVIQSSLQGKIDTIKDIVSWYSVSVQSLMIDAEKVLVTTDSGETLTAKLIVGADGALSKVRQLANINVSGYSYQQEAVVTTVQTTESHRKTAWQRFLPNGPLAFLPLRDGSSSIVWSTTLQQAAELKALDEKEFCVKLGIAFDHKLGEIKSCGARASFPLQVQHAEKYVLPRLALIGDAAHVIHPLAGQGVNLGLLDAAQLTEFLLEDTVKEKGYDIGTLRALRRYERTRRSENQIMLSAMSAMNFAFASDVEPIRVLRNLGLTTVNHLDFIKNHFMREAMGIEGEKPKLTKVL